MEILSQFYPKLSTTKHLLPKTFLSVIVTYCLARMRIQLLFYEYEMNILTVVLDRIFYGNLRDAGIEGWGSTCHQKIEWEPK